MNKLLKKGYFVQIVQDIGRVIKDMSGKRKVGLYIKKRKNRIV